MKKGYLILLIISLLTILIVCLFSYLIKPEEENPKVTTDLGIQLEKVIDRNDYYMVKNCVNKFYKYYTTMNDTKEDSDIEKTYILLDNEYINFKNITKENILEVLPIVKDSVINIISMYASQQNENISIYIVEGILRDEFTNQLSDLKIMIKIDSKNETFSVFLEDYIQEKYSNISLGDKLKVEKLTDIQSNRYNLYFKEEISDEIYVNDLINKYKEEVLYNIEIAYEHLDKLYRDQKFGTLSKFQEYVKDNRQAISNIDLTKYSRTQTKDYIQYLSIDKNGYYYIFRETNVMEYTLILDTYTIDLPEFTEKYNTANNVGKAGYNIQKCLNAINYKDYSYVYNKLDFEFKAINYPTLESFEKEIKSKLFNQNKVKTVSSLNEGSIYIFRLTITDINEDTKEQPMTIIMQLKEGTEFVMSFSFQ